MPFDEFDVIKVVIAVASVVALYLFRRKITSTIMDLMAGGDASRYKGESSQAILERIESRINEVIR